MTGISWTDETWNPIVGCSKVSEGCRNCYAIPQAKRNAAIGKTMQNPGRLAYYNDLTKEGAKVEWTGKVHFVPEAIDIPAGWRKPRMIFVNSMSDFFHDEVTDYARDRIFWVIKEESRHTYQILTKRPENMLSYLNRRPDYSRGINTWFGVTVENQETASRIATLRKTPVFTRFLSVEPLLEPVNLGRLRGIHWVVVGGESGPGARPCKIEWIRDIVRQCQAAQIPVFVKQLGSKCLGLGHGYTGKGVKTEEWPEDLRIQELPNPVTARIELS